MFAEVRPNFGRIVTCCRAEPSRTFGQILRPNFGVCRTSAHLYYKLLLTCCSVLDTVPPKFRYENFTANFMYCKHLQRVKFAVAASHSETLEAPYLKHSIHHLQTTKNPTFDNEIKKSCKLQQEFCVPSERVREQRACTGPC